MSHFQVTQRMVNKAVLAERVGGWRKLWWKRTACFTDEAALREFGRAPGWAPSATWSLGLLLSDFCFIPPSVPVTLNVCPHSGSCLSPGLHSSLYFFGAGATRRPFWVIVQSLAITVRWSHQWTEVSCINCWNTHAHALTYRVFFFRFYHSGGFPICWHNIKICAQDLHDCFHIKHSQLRGWAGGM